MPGGLPLFALVGVVLFSAFTIWAGIPVCGLPAFLAGLGVFLVLTLFFAGLAWHLLVRPLPPGQKLLRAEILSPTLRRLFAVFLLAAGISLVIGGFWDEVWHRKFKVSTSKEVHLVQSGCNPARRPAYQRTQLLALYPSGYRSAADRRHPGWPLVGQTLPAPRDG
jgi:hypothetical protein